MENQIKNQMENRIENQIENRMTSQSLKLQTATGILHFTVDIARSHCISHS